MKLSGRRRWVAVAAGLAGLALVVAALYRPRPLDADIARVDVGPIAETAADQGMARVREAYVVAAPVSGRLERVGLDVGDRVEAGRTPVATIRPAPAGLLDPRSRAQAQSAIAAADASVGAASAQHQRAAAEARRAEADAARMRTLAQRGFAAAQAVEAAQTAAAASRATERAAAAELRAQQANLALARAALMGPAAQGGERVAVTSPASGYVTKVLQESEGTVAMGAPLVEVSDNAGLEGAIEFLSQDAVRIREGMAAEIFDWGGEGVIPARVRRVEPQGFTKVSALGVEEQRVLVLLQFEGDRDRWARLAPGYRLWGRVFLRQEAKALRAPLGALVRADGGWAVFRVRNGRASLTAVSVGAMTDRLAEIRGGLATGDQLVVFPSDRVRDGVRVKER